MSNAFLLVAFRVDADFQTWLRLGVPAWIVVGLLRSTHTIGCLSDVLLLFSSVTGDSSQKRRQPRRAAQVLLTRGAQHAAPQQQPASCSRLRHPHHAAQVRKIGVYLRISGGGVGTAFSCWVCEHRAVRVAGGREAMVKRGQLDAIPSVSLMSSYSLVAILSR